MDILTKNLDEFVNVFYEDFFEKNEEIKKIFRNTELANQKEELKKSLTFILKIGDDKPILNDYLKQLGVRHLAYAISSNEYSDVKASLLKAFKTIYKDEWTKEIEKQTTEFVNFLCHQMQSGAQEIEGIKNVD